MILLNSKIQELFGFSQALILPIIGSTLMLFGISVFLVGFWEGVLKKKIVRIISLLDFGWVLGSLLTLVLQLFQLNTIAYACIGSIAIWILFLGIQQWYYND